ncbi:hypothetical protein N7490_001077 [Penicillium lividum]|nr:hypothetical protein N7490_001077 [Penicillium lividum]
MVFRPKLPEYLTGAINNFFNSNTTVTRQECDEFAISRAGAGPNKFMLFQFREENSTFDMGKISLAKTDHPEFVASCKYLGTIGVSRSLFIYETDKLPGTAHIMAGSSPDDMFRQRNIIMDFARDLIMMNFLTNPETRNITGNVDWAESRIPPFGFALYGPENIFGWMDSEGWHYYDRYCERERLFWETFREEAHNFSDTDLYLVRAARMAGLFYQYGF